LKLAWPLRPTDDVVVDDDAERRDDIDDRPCHGDVRLRRRRIARRMIVNEDERGRGELERALGNLARIDRGVVDRPDLLLLVRDQGVLLVEEKDPEHR
jgi:hypothetical protein